MQKNVNELLFVCFFYGLTILSIHTLQNFVDNNYIMCRSFYLFLMKNLLRASCLQSYFFVKFVKF